MRVSYKVGSVQPRMRALAITAKVDFAFDTVVRSGVGSYA